MTVKASASWLLSQGSASGLPTSGWRASAQAVLLHWWIDGMFAAPSGGRLIHCNCNALWTLRHERFTLRRVARVLAAPLSTVGRALKALGLGRLKNLQAAEPVRRYQWT